MIKILDCTLRDGGYINNWDFGHDSIAQIITGLENANIDFIECGFLKYNTYNSDKTFFPAFDMLEKFLPNNSASKYTLMINYGDVPLNNIKDCVNTNIFFRVAFKKHQRFEALEYCNELRHKGYNIIINPMHTNIYSSSELVDVINSINKISPYALTVVDTIGSMTKEDTVKLFYFVDNLLKDNISLGFHSHNNLLLSFSNAEELIKICTSRNLIIDSTLFGMGRGAGNIRTEQIVKYLNDYYSAKYNLLPLFEVIKEIINPIFSKTPWGYSLPYYLAAINQCHPDYAKYLNGHNISFEKINLILSNIPEKERYSFNPDLIKKLCNEYIC